MLLMSLYVLLYMVEMSLKPKFVNRFMHKFTTTSFSTLLLTLKRFQTFAQGHFYILQSPPALLETNKASTQISLSFSVADAADATVVVINVVVVRMK